MLTELENTLQGSEGRDDVRVLHVDGHSMRLPSFMRM